MQSSVVPALLLTAALVLPAGAAAQATRAGELRYPPLPRFDIPQPERVVLDNGMIVMLLEDHELPLIEATALIGAGSRFDPADKIGLARLGSEVMRAGGTESMPGDALDDFLESRAAAVELSADEDMAQARLSSLKADFPQVLRVFADVLRRPAFDAGKLEVARTQALTEVARQNDDAGQVMSREFRKIIYGSDSPFARRETYATVGGIRRDDLVAWHRAAFHPDRILLGLVGDFQRDEALRLIREAFGDWQRGPQWKPAEAAFRKQPSPGIYHVEKNDVTQSYIEIGHLGLRNDDPDYYALEVLNQVLSGSFASRLFANVRTRKGLAYAVGGGVFSEWDHPGLAVLYVSTKTETTAAGIEALLEEARNLKAQPPTAEEVEKAKQSLLNSFVFRFDTRREVLARQLLLEYFGYPLDWLSRYRAGVEAVTVEQVRQSARHLRPEDFAILVVGPATGLDKPLSTFGKVTPVDITIPGADGQGRQGRKGQHRQ
jgi:zinc protease